MMKVPQNIDGSEPTSLVSVPRDIQRTEFIATALKRLALNMATLTGEDFFLSLATDLALTLNIPHVFISELIGEQLHTLAIWTKNQLQQNITFDPKPAPCGIFMDSSSEKTIYHCPCELQSVFPDDPTQPNTEIFSHSEQIDLEFLLEDTPNMIKSMKLGIDRISDIMNSLRNYSRIENKGKGNIDIHEGIDTTLIILSHRLKANPRRPAIKVVKEYGELPLVECYVGQINQVFMNLLANAIDALEESNQGKSYAQLEINPNTITICTSLNSNQVRVRIVDNGVGMKEEVRQKLFSPFFTTKQEGKGTGLGLSISYQIITEQHSGNLQCFSDPGKGAEFVIDIPLNKE